MSKNPSQRVILIFNPLAGRSQATPNLLQEVILALQKQNFSPEVHLTEAGEDIGKYLDKTRKRTKPLYVVCGGDGTIESVSGWMMKESAVLGIIPAGTQNNLALSMGIPAEIDMAVALLRNGQRSKIDVGIARDHNREIPFLEVCSVGLFSALFHSADNLQKGDLASLGDLLSTLASFPLANIQLVLDHKTRVNLEGHVAMVANLPYFGLNYRLTSNYPYDDGILDVLVFTEFSKLELVGNVLQTAGSEPEDTRIRRYRAHEIEIHTDPAMPVQVDGVQLGETPVKITVRRRAITVITGLPGQNTSRWSFMKNMNFMRFFRK